MTNPRHLLTAGAASIALLAMLYGRPAFSHGDEGASDEKVQSLIADVRRATAPFQDVEAAKAAGYQPFRDCISEPGHGAMGIHYLNDMLVGNAVLDPLRPEALMYRPTKNGKLELVGVEYIVFQDAWDALHPQPPVLFGHPAHLVRSPNRYNVPAFYELHLWIWEHNRNGIFNDWNPKVACP